MFFPALRYLLKRLSQPTRPIHRPAHRTTARGFRPRLEILEDRTVPSTVNWTGGSGDWSSAANWTDASNGTHHTPGATDNAVINVAGITVTHSTGTDTVRTVTSEDAFVLSGGSLSISDGATFDSNFTQSNGTLSGTGNVTVNGFLTWTGGTMSGIGHTIADGGLALSNGGFPNPSTTLDGRALDNAGAAVWTGPGTISVGNGGSINNLFGAAFEDETDAALASFGSPLGSFNNAGSFTKLNSSGITNIGIAFNNSGTLDVQTGTFNLNAGGGGSGSYLAESGAVLGFGGGITTLGSASSVSGAGTVQISGDFFGSGTINELGSYSAANTNLAGETLNFNQDVTLTNLNQSGGTLTGFSNVTVTGTLNWTGGTENGAGTTTATGALNISGTGGKTLDTRTLNNAGTATWTGLDITVINGAILNNQSGANFNIQSDASISNSFNAPGTFNNAGALTKLASSSTTSINDPFNNSGTVEVQTGTLQLNNGANSSAISGGTFTVDSGATLGFSGNNTLSASSAVNGNGNVQFASGTVNVLGSFAPAGTVTVSGGTANFGTNVDLAALTFSSGTITGSGNVTVEGAFTWTGGTMSGAGTTLSNGTLSLSNSGFFGGPTLDGRTFNNAGTATWTGPNGIAVNNGSVINNLAGAEFFAEASTSLSGPGSVFNNFGDFDKTASTGTTTLGLAFNNSGTVEVETGTLSLGSGGDDTGTFTVGSGATLGFAGNTNRLESASSVSGAGTVQISGDFFGNGSVDVLGSYSVANTVITNGTVNFAVDNTISALTLSGGTLTGFGNLTVTGPLNWTGGAMTGAGSTTAAGTLSISGTGGKDLNGRALTNAGTAAWTGTGAISVRNGGVLDNQLGATFLIQSDTTLNGGGFFDTPGTFTNEGTLQKQASSGTTTISVAFSNTGTVDAHTGTLSFTAGYVQTAGTTSLSGGTLTATSGLFLQGGVLSGSGTVNGNVTNTGGEVAPGGDGAAGTLNINGNYVQTANGILSIDLGGTTVGTQYDQLHVSGSVTLDGTLQVQLINGFNPVAGNSFKVLTFGSRPSNTDFATDSFPDLGTGLTISPSYDSSSLNLVVQATT